MSIYRHILVAVEADDEARRLLARGTELAHQFGAELTVLHVVEPMPLNLNGDIGVMPLDLTSEVTEQAQRWLLPICAAADIDAARLRIELGSITHTIQSTAETLGIDLIVVGHHRQRGLLAALFSHTDQGVIGKAHCDVLAVALTPPAETAAA